MPIAAKSIVAQSMSFGGRVTESTSVRRVPTTSRLITKFGTMEAAKTFAVSTRLKEVIMSAGVQGTPEIWFATRV